MISLEKPDAPNRATIAVPEPGRTPVLLQKPSDDRADKRALLRQRLESGLIRVHHLAFPQRELWETSPVPVADPANHICGFVEIKGRITYEEAEMAIQRVVDRQEAMRISFLPGKESVLQVIRASDKASLEYRELSGFEARAEAIEELMKETFRLPFDLLQGPLYRVAMLRRAANDHVLVFAIHHAIADGWSLGVFVKDLCTAYVMGLSGLRKAVAVGVIGLSNTLPPVSQTYSEWAAAERAFWQPAVLEPRAAFWKSQLAGYRRNWSALEGPDTASGPHHRMITHFPAELANAARELARRSGATLFSALLAAFQVALSRWTGAQDILVGTPVANRTKQAMNETMGYFAGIVPLRSRVEPERSFSAALRALHQKTVDCFANAMPFAELARAFGDAGAPGHNPVFEVRFALQNHPIPDVKVPALSAKLRMRSTGTARFHLACEITEQAEELEVVWLFRPKLFPQAEVEKLGRIFQNLLASACRSPESSINALANELS
jgi:hypothetical protein